jgi:Sigma-70 region 2
VQEARSILRETVSGPILVHLEGEPSFLVILSIADPMPDMQAVVRRCQEGQLDAFTTLFSHYQDDVYDLARTILRDGQEAEDVVQDTVRRKKPWDRSKVRNKGGILLAKY